jgi:hypothetical protein
VDRIGKSITGEVQLDLTHFPVDANLASVVAQEVNAATGTGLLLPTGLSGITCDVNSSADTSVPAETFTAGTFPDYGSNIGGFNESGLGDPPVDNPEDGEDGQSTPSGAQPTLTSTGNINAPIVGDTLTAPVICDGGQVVFYRLDPSVTGGKVIVAQATSTYTLVINDIDKSVYSETRCPDPSAPTGYGEPISSTNTPFIGRLPLTEWTAAYGQTVTLTITMSGTVTWLNCGAGSPTTSTISKVNTQVLAGPIYEFKLANRNTGTYAGSCPFGTPGVLIQYDILWRTTAGGSITTFTNGLGVVWRTNDIPPFFGPTIAGTYVSNTATDTLADTYS